MKTSTFFGSLLLMMAPLHAQTIDTLGGTTTASTRASAGKANVFRVDTTVLLINIEMYLNVPGVEVLTYFIYRHHSKDGTYLLEWTKQVNVNGTGVGPAWYPSGPVALPLVGGNHYQIGVAWPGAPTYYYITATSGQPVSFGAWHRATTPLYPLPPTFTVSGLDIARSYQRLTTVAFPAVVTVGTGCSGSAALAPRLVAGSAPQNGTQMTLFVVDAVPSAAAVYIITFGPPLATPIPVLCGLFWLNAASGPVITAALAVSGTGEAALPLAVPPDASLVGLKLSTQAAVLAAGVDLTNALQLTIY